MKKVLFVIASIFLLNCIFITTTQAEKINNGPMTLELPQSIEAEGVSKDPVTVKLNVPNTWSMSTNNGHDYVFKHLINPGKIEITLINMATYYKNEESKAMIIDSSMKGGGNSFKQSALKANAQYEKAIGVDNIVNKAITYCLFTLMTQTETTYYKFLYPASDKNIFLIYIYFKDGAPFEDAEQLINNIVLALTDSH